jgi:16S rRNA (guanine527-N7)-methyltransferase
METPLDGRGLSRETPSSTLLQELFPEDKAIRRYIDLLAGIGVDRGLIGPREVPRLWSRHVLNCAVITPAFPHGSSVVDVGSGAGLPGVVLALARPDLRVCLLEPLLRRATFLGEVVADLGLENVEVVRARAEELHAVRTFTVATARAVAPLHRLMEWCWPLVAPGGRMLALKGAAAQDEVVSSRSVLRRFGIGAVVEQWGADVTTPPTTLVRIESLSGPRED